MRGPKSSGDSMNTPVRRVRHRRARAGATQLLCVATGIGLGLTLPRIDGGPRAPARQVTELLFAIAVGLVAYCITAAFTIGHDNDTSLVVPAAAMLLVLLMLGMLRALQFRAFAAIQLSPALDSIAAPGRTVLGDLAAVSGAGSPPAPLPPRQATIIWQHPPAVLQRVDEDRFVAAARTANAVVVIRHTPGATLHHGIPVADTYCASMPEAAVLAALDVGTERTFEQDPLLAFRLLADIALRALSPAINDPATTVQALDELGDLLVPPTYRSRRRDSPTTTAPTDSSCEFPSGTSSSASPSTTSSPPPAPPRWSSSTCARCSNTSATTPHRTDATPSPPPVLGRSGADHPLSPPTPDRPDHRIIHAIRLEARATASAETVIRPTATKEAATAARATGTRETGTGATEWRTRERRRN